MLICDGSAYVCSSDLSDPFDPKSTPIKRTALGRFKHENAALTQTSDGHAVVYMGDDERGEFIYKFVSRDKIDHKKPKANRNLLDHGTLYVARFDAGAAKIGRASCWERVCPYL